MGDMKLYTSTNPDPNTARPSAASLTITVRLFAGAKALVGLTEVQIELAQPATVGELRRALSHAYPQLGPLVSRASIAIDNQYVHDDQSVRADAQVACIPPVSGG